MCDEIRVCSRCNCEVVFDEDLVTDGYKCACLVHDEDLFSFETKIVQRDKVRLFIDSDDKEHYRKHGYLPLSKLDEVEECF